ncbi:MAG TPA: polymer-forming cytoskeletal protein [Desulfobacteraceae bacterium]|nr:polymer-forming cytoskeletal protein [Desulfobacteraceae bacterium]
MSLFNKKDSESQEAMVTPPVKTSKTSGDVISSIISTDMRVTGEMSFKGKARVDGIVEGNVKGEHLILSESGKVYGDLELSTLICHGAIEGNVKAQKVTAHSSSSLTGNLIAASLTVESGAKLNGEVSSSSQPPQKTQPAASPQKTEAEKKEAPKS